MRPNVITALLYGCEKRGPERFRDLLEVTQHVVGIVLCFMQIGMAFPPPGSEVIYSHPKAPHEI